MSPSNHEFNKQFNLYQHQATDTPHLYYLTNPLALQKRAEGKFIVPDTIAAELVILANPIVTKIISQEELLKLVDDGVMPSDAGTIIFVKHYSKKILSYLRVMKNRGFKIVNSYETITNIRDVDGWTTTMESQGVPVRKPFNGQPFAKKNVDRTRGFGQGFEDFMVEYIKEYKLVKFNLRPRFGVARWQDTQNLYGGYTVEDAASFDWTKVDLSLHQYFIIDGLPTKTFRVPVVGGKIIGEACLSTNRNFIDNLPIAENTNVIKQHPEIELYALKAIMALNLEIGYIDFNLIDNEIKMLDISNYEQRPRVNPFDLTPLVIDYLVQRHES